MKRWSKRPPPSPKDPNDFDDVNYDVLVHLPLGGAPPAAEIVQLAVSEALNLRPDQVEARMFLPCMGG